MAFPSVVKLHNGDIIVAFREAIQRQPYSNHLDSETNAVMVRSKDNGENWGGKTTIHKGEKDTSIQDPSITQLKDGSLIANFFSFHVVKQEPFNHYVKGTFAGRSFDNGANWEEKVNKISVPDYYLTATSEPVLEFPGGELLMPMYGNKKGEVYSVFLMRSYDKGETWSDYTLITGDPLGHFQFCEPSFCLTRSGKIICMLRDESNSIEGNYLYQSNSLDRPRSKRYHAHVANARMPDLS